MQCLILAGMICHIEERHLRKDLFGGKKMQFHTDHSPDLSSCYGAQQTLTSYDTILCGCVCVMCVS